MYNVILFYPEIAAIFGEHLKLQFHIFPNGKDVYPLVMCPTISLNLPHVRNLSWVFSL